LRNEVKTRDVVWRSRRFPTSYWSAADFNSVPSDAVEVALPDLNCIEKDHVSVKNLNSKAVKEGLT
jgi:hypothetical protein